MLCIVELAQDTRLKYVVFSLIIIIYSRYKSRRGFVQLIFQELNLSGLIVVEL